MTELQSHGPPATRARPQPSVHLADGEMLLSGRSREAVERAIGDLRRDQRLISVGRLVERDGGWSVIVEALPERPAQKARSQRIHPAWYIGVLGAAAALIAAIGYLIGELAQAVVPILGGLAVLAGIILLVGRKRGGGFQGTWWSN